MTGSVTITKRNQMMGAFTASSYFVSESSGATDKVYSERKLPRTQHDGAG